MTIVRRPTKVLIGQSFGSVSAFSDTKVALINNKYANATANDDSCIIAQGLPNASNDGTHITKLDNTIDDNSAIYSYPIYKNSISGAYKINPTDILQEVLEFDLSDEQIIKGNEYRLTVIYKNTKGFLQNRQNKRTYTYLAKTDSLNDLINYFITQVNKDSFYARILVYRNDKGFVIVGRDMKQTYDLNDIDNYAFNFYDASLVEISYLPSATSLNAYSERIFGNVNIINPGNIGSGDWKLLRDREKAAKGYRGLTNRISFPIPKLNYLWYTVKGTDTKITGIGTNAQFQIVNLAIAKDAVIVNNADGTYTIPMASTTGILNGDYVSINGLATGDGYFKLLDVVTDTSIKVESKDAIMYTNGTSDAKLLLCKLLNTDVVFNYNLVEGDVINIINGSSINLGVFIVNTVVGNFAYLNLSDELSVTATNNVITVLGRTRNSIRYTLFTIEHSIPYISDFASMNSSLITTMLALPENTAAAFESAVTTWNGGKNIFKTL